MKKQVGNAMHFHHVGMIFFITLMKFPSLRANVPPSTSIKRSLEDAATVVSSDDDDDTKVKRISDKAKPRPTASSLLRAVRARRASDASNR